MTSGIPEDSEEENDFIKYIITNLQYIDFSNISDIPELEGKVSQLGTTLVEAWNKYAKVKNIVNRSKEWWNQECSSTLEDYRRTRDPQNWKAFKKATKKAKQTFFDERITEIATTNKRPWDLMGWIKKRKLPTTEAIKFQDQPCNDLPDLWNALHTSYNGAANRSVDLTHLEDAPIFEPRTWTPFTRLELQEALKKCANKSAPGPDHITWRHLKKIINYEEALDNILTIANKCISLSYWPQHFKESMSVIIPKPNKPSYDSPKAFRPIVLLNTIGKLIEKMIAKRLQFEAVKLNIVHPNQLGGITQRSTEDAGLFLTHVIQAG